MMEAPDTAEDLLELWSSREAVREDQPRHTSSWFESAPTGDDDDGCLCDACGCSMVPGPVVLVWVAEARYGHSDTESLGIYATRDLAIAAAERYLVSEDLDDVDGWEAVARAARVISE